MADSVEYLMILNIKKIIKKDASSFPRNSQATSEDYRSEVKVIELVIRDKNLDSLLDRGGKHIALVTDEG